MKKVIILTVTLLLSLMLAACNCEHRYEEKITTEASCTAVGVKTFTCTECNESYTEEIPVLEHAYKSAITKDPTCVEKGVKTFTCETCKGSYTEEIEMVAHTIGDIKVIKEPTCTQEGEKGTSCTVCGATDLTESIAKLEHSYKDNFC